MGFIIKVYRSGQDLSFLRCPEPSCLLGLDLRGVPCITSSEKRPFLELLELSQNNDGSARTKALASELRGSNSENINQGSVFLFPTFIHMQWRDISFEIFYISPQSFLMAKLNINKVPICAPLYELACKEKNFSVEIFPNTTITIGSHLSDTLKLTSIGVKPKHAALKVQSDASSLEITGYLGNIQCENKDGISFFKLLPSNLEFVVRPV